mgnify:CR=1 FL=1
MLGTGKLIREPLPAASPGNTEGLDDDGSEFGDEFNWDEFKTHRAPMPSWEEYGTGPFAPTAAQPALSEKQEFAASASPGNIQGLNEGGSEFGDEFKTHHDEPPPYEEFSGGPAPRDSGQGLPAVTADPAPTAAQPVLSEKQQQKFAAAGLVGPNFVPTTCRGPFGTARPCPAAAGSTSQGADLTRGAIHAAFKADPAPLSLSDFQHLPAAGQTVTPAYGIDQDQNPTLPSSSPHGDGMKLIDTDILGNDYIQIQCGDEDQDNAFEDVLRHFTTWTHKRYLLDDNDVIKIKLMIVEKHINSFVKWYKTLNSTSVDFMAPKAEKHLNDIQKEWRDMWREYEPKRWLRGMRTALPLEERMENVAKGLKSKGMKAIHAATAAGAGADAAMSEGLKAIQMAGNDVDKVLQKLSNICRDLCRSRLGLAEDQIKGVINKFRQVFIDHAKASQPVGSISAGGGRHNKRKSLRKSLRKSRKKTVRKKRSATKSKLKSKSNTRAKSVKRKSLRNKSKSRRRR